MSLHIVVYLSLWHLMGMRSVFMRAFNMIKIGVVHSVIELFLGQSFFFSLFRFPPEFVSRFVAQIVFTINRFLSIGVKKLPFIIFLCPAFDFLPHFLPYIRSVQHDQSASSSNEKSFDSVNGAFSSSRSNAVPKGLSRSGKMLSSISRMVLMS